LQPHVGALLPPLVPHAIRRLFIGMAEARLAKELAVGLVIAAAAAAVEAGIAIGGHRQRRREVDVAFGGGRPGLRETDRPLGGDGRARHGGGEQDAKRKAEHGRSSSNCSLSNARDALSDADRADISNRERMRDHRHPLKLLSEGP
jgi:hypothetical protein